MDLNRNQYFMAGLVVFLLGIQLRMVDGFVLNQRATQFLTDGMQQVTGKPQQQVVSADVPTLFSSPPTNKRLEPPNWLGWSFVSVGSVLVLYSLALKKPAG